MYLKKEIKANDRLFDIEIENLHEIQPGRKVWLFSINIGNQDVTPQLTSQPYLSQELNEWTELSLDKRFIFIPIEFGSILLDTASLQKQQLPYCKYKGNKFSENRLIVYGGYAIHVTDLNSKYTVNYYLDEEMVLDKLLVLNDTTFELWCLNEFGKIEKFILDTELQTLLPTN